MPATTFCTLRASAFPNICCWSNAACRLLILAMSHSFADRGTAQCLVACQQLVKLPFLRRTSQSAGIPISRVARRTKKDCELWVAYVTTSLKRWGIGCATLEPANSSVIVLCNCQFCASGPFSSIKPGSIGVRAAVPLPLPLHAGEFHGCAQHERASALPERPPFVGFQRFV